MYSWHRNRRRLRHDDFRSPKVWERHPLPKLRNASRGVAQRISRSSPCHLMDSAKQWVFGSNHSCGQVPKVYCVIGHKRKI